MEDDPTVVSTSDLSFQNLSNQPCSSSDEIDSLPSTDASTISEDDAENDAEREWRESLQQLELLLTMVLVPYLGKYFGRKAAYWSEPTIFATAKHEHID